MSKRFLYNHRSSIWFQIALEHFVCLFLSFLHCRERKFSHNTKLSARKRKVSGRNQSEGIQIFHCIPIYMSLCPNCITSLPAFYSLLYILLAHFATLNLFSRSHYSPSINRHHDEKFRLPKASKEKLKPLQVQILEVSVIVLGKRIIFSQPAMV